MTLKFTNEHEWLRLEGDTGTVGITDYAQQQLGDVVYVELPEIGRTVAKGEAVAVVESVKAASDIYAPAAGEIIAVNSALADAPGEVNNDAMGAGWFYKLRLSSPQEADALMDQAAYDAFVKSLA